MGRVGTGGGPTRGEGDGGVGNDGAICGGGGRQRRQARGRGGRRHRLAGREAGGRLAPARGELAHLGIAGGAGDQRLHVRVEDLGVAGGLGDARGLLVHLDRAVGLAEHVEGLGEEAEGLQVLRAVLVGDLDLEERGLGVPRPPRPR